jgi:hypothetical protein
MRKPPPLSDITENFTKSEREKIDILRQNFKKFTPPHLLNKNQELTLESFLWYLS